MRTIGEAEALSALVDGIQQELADRLATNGWSIDARVGGFAPRFSILFQHPLTSDFVVSLDSEKDFRPTLDRFLANPTAVTPRRVGRR